MGGTRMEHADTNRRPQKRKRGDGKTAVKEGDIEDLMEAKQFDPHDVEDMRTSLLKSLTPLHSSFFSLLLYSPYAV